jgi:hypothetical protein
MTGPPYPRPDPAPGSNAIGSFAIGISPIGTIEAFDVWSTVISQYANSPALTQLITDMDSYLDQTANFDAFFDLIWNVDTAEGYGLDIWGRIVGVSRTLSVPSTGSFFGWEEAGDAEGWNQQPWFVSTVTSNFSLPDNAFRVLIFAKALSNISDGSIPGINQLLLNLFPNRGNCYVIDGLDMTITYFFNFILTPLELAIIQQSGVLPRPCGVLAHIATTPHA